MDIQLENDLVCIFLVFFILILLLCFNYDDNIIINDNFVYNYYLIFMFIVYFFSIDFDVLFVLIFLRIFMRYVLFVFQDNQVLQYLFI